MEQFVGYLVKNLVDTPEEVTIETHEGERGPVIQVRCAKKDIAKVIGRGGKTIQALRTVAMTAAARLGTRVRIEVVE